MNTPDVEGVLATSLIYLNIYSLFSRGEPGAVKTPRRVHEYLPHHGEPDTRKAGHPVGHAGVVETVFSEPVPVPVARQLDRVGAAAGFPWESIELEQGLEGEGDVERELARLEDVVQLQAPRTDALRRRAELVLDEREVEARPVERAEPIRPVQEGHELLRAVEHGDELPLFVQPGEEEDLLDPRVRVVHGRAGDQARRRVQSGRLQVECQHPQGLHVAPPRPRARRPSFFYQRPWSSRSAQALR